jgi:hypothetical protein
MLVCWFLALVLFGLAALPGPVSLVGGLTANLRLDMKANVIQFFSLLDNANQRAD